MKTDTQKSQDDLIAGAYRHNAERLKAVRGMTTEPNKAVAAARPTATFTPGPWKTGDSDWRTIVGPETRCYRPPFDPEADFLVGIATVDLSNNEAEDLANARLIAAAPEFKAIAERWLAWANGPVVPIAVRTQLEADTRAVLAKAKGQP